MKGGWLKQDMPKAALAVSARGTGSEILGNGIKWGDDCNWQKRCQKDSRRLRHEQWCRQMNRSKKKRLHRSKNGQASVIHNEVQFAHYTVMISFSFWVSTSSIFLI